MSIENYMNSLQRTRQVCLQQIASVFVDRQHIIDRTQEMIDDTVPKKS